ncbi:SpeD S-adenosylmethionine decarboxylase [Fimbriimonadaceae bacterium]
MTNNLLLISTLVLGAIATPATGTFIDWIRNTFGRKAKAAQAATLPPPPQIQNDAGWTLIHCEDEVAFGEWLGHDEEGLPARIGEEPSLGSHLLIELYGCNHEALEKEVVVGKAMKDAAIQSEATVVTDSFHEFKPYGVSGAVIIQESHYTIHTWPEHGYAAVDLFYCGGTILVHRAVEVLKERFQPTRIKFLVVRRGLHSEVNR